MPVALYTLGIAFKKDTFMAKVMANMVSISLAIAIIAYGEARFDSWGVFL